MAGVEGDDGKKRGVGERKDRSTSWDGIGTTLDACMGRGEGMDKGTLAEKGKCFPGLSFGPLLADNPTHGRLRGLGI